MRGATVLDTMQSLYEMFQSTRPMRGATIRQRRHRRKVAVSIHAPHAGRDDLGGVVLWERQVSIHAPHAGRDVTGTLP